MNFNEACNIALIVDIFREKMSTIKIAGVIVPQRDADNGNSG
jgi:hypothetical protein